MLYTIFFSELTMMHNGMLWYNEKRSTEQHPVHFNCTAVVKGSAQQC